MEAGGDVEADLLDAVRGYRQACERSEKAAVMLSRANVIVTSARTAQAEAFARVVKAAFPERPKQHMCVAVICGDCYSIEWGPSWAEPEIKRVRIAAKEGM